MQSLSMPQVAPVGGGLSDAPTSSPVDESLFPTCPVASPPSTF